MGDYAILGEYSRERNFSFLNGTNLLLLDEDFNLASSLKLSLDAFTSVFNFKYSRFV